MNYAIKDRLWKEVQQAFGPSPRLLLESTISFRAPGIRSSAQPARMFQGICAGVRCSDKSGAVLTVWFERDCKICECEVRPEQVREILICESP